MRFQSIMLVLFAGMRASYVRFCVAAVAMLASVAHGMDQARVETGVDAAVAKYGVTGAGVIVAIIDRGIDWANNDFRNADGTTRIAGMFDLTDSSGSNSPANPYHIGTIYTQAQINGALINGTNLAERDALGHGTATTGIACGNGNNLWKYRGVAYNATILVVRFVAEDVPAHGNQPAQTNFQNLNNLPVAIQYVRDQANALGEPAVMLLNIGSCGGPMDGTSGLCQSINQAVGPGIPGFVFVTGSSDEGGMANHAAGTVAPNGTNTINIYHGSPGTVNFDLWYSSTDRFDVTITTPDGTFGPYASPVGNNTYTLVSTNDFLYEHFGGSVNLYNTIVPEREIFVQLKGPTGAYSVSLTGTVVTNGHFNASLNPSQFYITSANSNYFTTFAVPGYKVWDLASATNNICPNDYVHRTNWVDINGVARWSIIEGGGIGQLWGGTGLGPTYDGRIGVDVSAPGDNVFTTYDTNSYWATSQFNLIQDGLGLYGRASATSAASPLVTGIIALMLQMNPKLDAAMVKQILHQSARADAFTGAVPNPQWGYGKVNASNAVAMVQATFPEPANPVVINHHFQEAVQPAVPGWQYLLQSSTNLVSWSAVVTNTASSNLLEMVDPGIASGARFYRVFTQ